jgi:hypothetical protein
MPRQMPDRFCLQRNKLCLHSLPHLRKTGAKRVIAQARRQKVDQFGQDVSAPVRPWFKEI